MEIRQYNFENCVSVQYDVVRDGGLIGDIDTGIQVPAGANLLFGRYFGQEVFGSGGAAEISFVTSNGVIRSNTFAVAALPLIQILFTGLRDFDDADYRLFLRIGVADLLAGRCVFLFGKVPSYTI